MKWAEMIRVRSSADGIAYLNSELPQVMATLRQKAEIEEAFMLIHALYSGDLAVILIWNGPGKPGKSPDGIFLANNFEEYGTVEHAVWLIASNGMGPSSILPES
jgi:hypothetical protein